MDFAIQNYARTNIVDGGHAVRVNTFWARFDPDNPLRYLNYAVPDDGVAITAADIADLVAAFQQRGRLPRLEYIPALAPELETLLLAQGFSVEGRMPMMACDVPVEVPPPSWVTLTEPTTMADYLAAVRVQFAAFGDSRAPTETDARTMLAAPAERGGIVAVAVAGDGEIIGVGQCGAVIDGVTELAGVAVTESARGRGIGAAITGYLASRAQDMGARTIWLDPSGDGARRVYERAGFAVVGQRLYISREVV